MLLINLKQLRKLKGVTQKQVAMAINMSERNYQQLEAGGRPHCDNLLLLAEYFNVSIDYLVGRTDNPEVNK